MQFKNPASRRAAFANMNNRGTNVMGGEKYTPTEPVFFADTYSEAVDYATEKHNKDPKYSMLPSTIHMAKDQNPNTSMIAWTGYRMKPMSKHELEYREFSPEAKRGIDIFSSMSSSEMDKVMKEYEAQTNRVAGHILNKEDVYSWIDATQLPKPKTQNLTQSEAVLETKLDKRYKEYANLFETGAIVGDRPMSREHWDKGETAKEIREKFHKHGW